MRNFVALALLACFALSACGPVGQPNTLPAPQGAWSPSTRAVASHRVRRVRVVLRIDWKGKRHKRRAHYLPGTARSISFTVNGSHTQYANFPAPTIYVDAPV